MTASRFAWRLVAVASTLALAGACADTNNFVNENPPPVGAVVGAGGSVGSYGYGASNPQGGAGGGEPPPPMCADEFKQCPHTFTIPDNGEMTVELRGNFAPDGWDVGADFTTDGTEWSVTVDTIPWDTQVEYKLIIDGVWQPDPTNPNQVDDGFGGFNSLLAPLTCPDDFTCAPPLLGDFDWRDAVLYFVFVDRFFDGNPGNNGSPVPGVATPANYQGGDFVGVTQKLQEGYFTDLGINALWITVPFENTNSAGAGIGGDTNNYSAYHGYWPTDLNSVESRFGTQQELQDLIDEAHSRDIKVIVDYAMNHVHIESQVYQQNPGWFWPLNDNGKYCVCGADCAWDGADGRKCWFTDYLPDFNFNVQAARDYSVGNAIQWIKDLGIDGYRLDAVKHIEDSWLLDLRSRVKSEIETETQQHFYMVGETFTGDKGVIASYVDPNTKLDGQFDFPMRNAIVNSVLIRNAPMTDLENFLVGNDGYYGSGIMSTFVGNHDVPRPIHFALDTPLWADAWADGKERAWQNQPGLPSGTSAFERLATSFTILYTLPGVPLVYYGDEIGLPGAGDPDNRRFMQWSGYSAGQTLLRDHLSVLAQIRADHPALRRGTRSTLSVNADTLAYRMSTNGDEVVVLLNRGDSAQSVANIPNQAWVDALDGSNHNGGSVNVPARGSRILVSP